MEKTVGFVGLGVMGAPMAQNLSARYTVFGYDIDAKRFERATGVIRSESVREVAEKAEYVFLSLPASAIVRDAAIGAQGLISAAESGSVVIDTSTTEPAVSQEIARMLAEREIRFLDAPVSGGEKAAIEGTLSFMVGGPEDVFAECRPFFQTMGESIVRVGDTGMGEVAKLINNLIVGITFAAVAEGFALGKKAGIDPSALYQAIQGGWAGSKVLEVAASEMLSREFKPGGTVDIHWKDLGYALSLAREQDVPTPFTALAHELFKAARASGKGKLSQPAIVQLWESLLGIEVK